MESVAALVESVRRKGVRVWAENGHLRYQAPRGALTGEDAERLRAFRSEIICLLESSGGAVLSEYPPDRHIARSYLPLAFSQLHHWNINHLSERPSARTVASATRLSGKLDLRLLRHSVVLAAARQESLRLRIVPSGEGLAQRVSESVLCELEISDLTGLPSELREHELSRLIERCVLEPIDITIDPLVEIRVFKLQEDEHVLLIAMEHVVSDAVSRGILFRDVLTAYAQLVNGKPVSLPPVSLQFTEYAVWQHRNQESWIYRHLPYWKEHLLEFPRIRFPAGGGTSGAGASGWGEVPVHVCRDLKTKLQESCRSLGTTLAMGVFTAYATLVARWCGVPEVLIQYQINGRDDPRLENTIGYFAALLYLRVEILENDSFVDVAARVAREYCRAYEHVDAYYLATRDPVPEFTGNTSFNWISLEPANGLSTLDDPSMAIVSTPHPVTLPAPSDVEFENEPMIMLFENERGVSGSIYFSASRLTLDQMQRFERNLNQFMRRLAESPSTRVMSIPLL